MAVLVPEDRINGRMTLRIARDDAGDFQREGDDALDDAGSAIEGAPGWVEFVRVVEADLAAAVVAGGGGFEDQRAGELEGAVEVGLGADGAPVGDGEAVAGEEGFFADAVLGDPDGVPTRTDRKPSAEPADAGGVDVLEFDGDGVATLGKGTERFEVGAGVAVRWGENNIVGDLGGGIVGGGGEGDGAIAEVVGGLDEHTAELAAAEYAEAGRRMNRIERGGHAGRSGTAAVCSRRKRSRASRMAGSERARMAAASSAALAAPAGPMARVPTGIPRGI